MSYLYSKFEKLCEDRSVRPSDVSKATGVSTATISSWKKGRYSPKIDKLNKIADYFGVDSSYFSDEVQKSDNSDTNSSGYYLDPETAKAAQEVFDDPNLRILFDAARDSRPEDIRMAADMLKRFKETNPDG